jgi:3-deoxy-D-manno-oct-2-ulosonic acid (Kdo) hydroxylase
MPVREMSDITAWGADPGPELARRATEWVESGDVLWLSRLRFDLTAGEQRFLTPSVSDGKAKNISVDSANGAIGGTSLADNDRQELAAMIRRFTHQARAIVDHLFPHYGDRLQTRLASYRPIGVEGRPQSAKKDDTRLHMDAFASRPNRGARILRVFTNLNSAAKARVWNVGEPFEPFAARFIPRIPRYSAAVAWLLEAMRVTKTRRTEYDHVMLKLHDLCKLDAAYQAECPKARFEFPPGSSWICFSDQVLHAVLGGQFMLEQTYLLPVEAMAHPERSPLRILERHYGRALT